MVKLRCAEREEAGILNSDLRSFPYIWGVLLLADEKPVTAEALLRHLTTHLIGF